MPVVAIIAQKGGGGKTTLATNLSWALAQDVSTVLLLDADPQASSQNWAAGPSQAPETPTVQAAGNQDLMRLAGSAAAEHEWLIIDGPPGITRTSADAVRAADVVLIPGPTQPARRVGRLRHRGRSQSPPGNHARRPDSGLRHHHGKPANPPQPADRRGP